jgi:hypothetical protein
MVDPYAKAMARKRTERDFSIHGLDFDTFLLIHELGHVLANNVCGRKSWIEIEREGFGHACFERARVSDRCDEAFIAAMGSAVGLAHVLTAKTDKAFLDRYIWFAASREAQQLESEIRTAVNTSQYNEFIKWLMKRLPTSLIENLKNAVTVRCKPGEIAVGRFEMTDFAIPGEEIEAIKRLRASARLHLMRLHLR